MRREIITLFQYLVRKFHHNCHYIIHHYQQCSITAFLSIIIVIAVISHYIIVYSALFTRKFKAKALHIYKFDLKDSLPPCFFFVKYFYIIILTSLKQIIIIPFCAFNYILNKSGSRFPFNHHHNFHILLDKIDHHISCALVCIILKWKEDGGT